MAKQAELLQGTLDLLILRTLELRPLHGVGISDRIEQVTRGVFAAGPGSLFPALHRLAAEGWIEGQWTELESERRVKVYALTRSGRAASRRETKLAEDLHGDEPSTGRGVLTYAVDESLNVFLAPAVSTLRTGKGAKRRSSLLL